MGMICLEHNVEMKLVTVIDRIGEKFTAIYSCSKCKKNKHIKSEDWKYTFDKLKGE